MKLEFYPATPERWPDVELLFGKRGACGGCWCRWWKESRPVFEKQKGEGNRRALKKSVQAGEVPGILAYCKGEPVGWCALEPRDRFPRLDRSRILARVDDRPVWSVPCFFVRRDYRNRGLTVQLLKAAAAFARKQGARILEGYPVAPRKARMPDVFAYVGLPSTFLAAGFQEVARRSETRPVMRKHLKP